MGLLHMHSDMPVNVFPFWGINSNEFENLGMCGSAPGKQNLSVTCPKGGNSIFFSSPVVILDLLNLN